MAVVLARACWSRWWALDGLFVQAGSAGEERLRRGRRDPGGGRHRLRRQAPAPRVSGERKSQDYYTVADPGPGHGGRRQHGHHAAGQLRRDRNQKATVMSIPGIPW
ncbi:MAG: hypothetical protein ACLU38_03170 [Dysosmobacter sp.]